MNYLSLFPSHTERDVCYDFFVNSEITEMEVVIVACQRKTQIH